MPYRRRAPRSVRVLAAAAALTSLLTLAASPSLAADPLTLTTPYPAIAVQPGATASFELALKSIAPRRVDLAVSGVPSGWTATVQGGGFQVASVWVDPASPPSLKLDVKVPADASQGTYQLTATASSGSLSVVLTVDLKVAQAAGGTVELTSDFPGLRGSSDQSFPFNLTLRNDTPQPITFSLSASGPQDWQVQARPSSQSQAASFSLDAGSTAGVSVNVTPARDAAAGTYPITVQAVGGGRTAETKLQVEITGNVAIDLTTPDQRLSTNASAGSGKEFQLVVKNTGTSPAQNVQLSATQPTGWKVTFTPDRITEIAANGSATATALITPSGEAIAGDYVVTMRAAAGSSTKSVDIRVTVETSLIWALVGAGLIVLTLAALGYVYRRFGRR